MLWLIVLIGVIFLMSHRAGYTDEVTIQKIVQSVKQRFPSMEPVNTTSIDNGTARVTFFDRNTYAGSVVDASTKGILPRAPPDMSIQAYHDAEYKSYDEIRAA